MRAVRVHEAGDPEVLGIDNIPAADPRPGQVRVRVVAAGLNFIDVYQRSGLYEIPLPATLGMEGAGTVDVVGPGVEALRRGDRVAFTGCPGAYAETIVAPAAKLVRVPETIDLEIAAAVMLQGITAHYLATSTFALSPDHTALVLAAAGGVGHLLVQVARQRGARVIATASTTEKAELAHTYGADAVILYRDEDMVEAVRELTGGEGVHVVYDSVGRDTLHQSLDCLRPRGYCVLYGQSSGPVDPVDPRMLADKGSLFLTRPGIGHYIADRAELEWRTRELFGWIASGQVQVRIDRRWPLEGAAEAHAYMEAGKTRGKVLLVP